MIVSSVVVDNEAIPAKQQDTGIEELTNYIEEADCGIISNAEWSVRVQHCKRVVVIPNDADTFALLLHYTPEFREKRMETIWQGYGLNCLILPLHALSDHLGVAKSKVVIKSHIITGQDCIIKIGTKHFALYIVTLFST